jgi:hypothetical protein
MWDDSPDTPSVIILATYENQLDYETLRPEDQPARVEDHTEMIHHIKTLVDWEFSGSGPDIQTPVIQASDYLRWLATNGLTNDAGNRAMFISNPILS